MENDLKYEVPKEPGKHVVQQHMSTMAWDEATRDEHHLGKSKECKAIYWFKLFVERQGKKCGPKSMIFSGTTFEVSLEDIADHVGRFRVRLILRVSLPPALS